MLGKQTARDLTGIFTVFVHVKVEVIQSTQAHQVE